MTIINVANISRMDLNLLVVFQCLMNERSVTRTAEILSLTQGAVSSSLKRLREQFGDDLFVRGTGGMAPTRRALELAPTVSEALGAVSTLIDGRKQFAAETSRPLRLDGHAVGAGRRWRPVAREGFAGCHDTSPMHLGAIAVDQLCRALDGLHGSSVVLGEV